MKIIFLDTETTDKEPTPDGSVLSYAFAEWDSEKDEPLIRGVDSQIVLPRHGCSAEAARVNGYDEAKWRVAGAKHWSTEDTQNVLSYLTDGCIVGGSNPDFDLRWLRHEFQLAGQLTYWPDVGWRTLNTATLGFPLWATGVVHGVGLGTLAEFFGIPHETHTAEGDVLASIKVWEAFYARYIDEPARMRSALVGIAENYPEDPELVKFCREAVGT